MNRLSVVLLIAMLFAHSAHGAAIEVEGYAQETLPGAAISAAYLVLHNGRAEERRLRAVTLPQHLEASADLHISVSEEGISRMRPLAELVVPAGSSVRMEPGGVHLMLHKVRLRAGEQLSLKLYFASGEVIEVSVPVRGMQPAAGHHHG